MVLNSQASSWADVKTGVPQESILVPLFFLIYMNDLSEKTEINCQSFYRRYIIFHVAKDQ